VWVRALPAGGGAPPSPTAWRVAAPTARRRQPKYRHAVREVIGRCTYGVDLEPLAVELCKVSLWMEAIEPGLPLSFLDAHVQLRQCPGRHDAGVDGEGAARCGVGSDRR
jgi:hypothetical protein